MGEIGIEEVEESMLEHPSPVVSATDLADDLGCSSRHVLDILRSLERVGVVGSRSVGSRAIAWWHTDRIATDPPASVEEATTDTRAMDKRPSRDSRATTDEQPTNEQQASQEATTSEQQESDDREIEEIANRAAEAWDDAERVEERKAAVLAVLRAIREQPMSRSEVLDEIEPEHPVPDQSPATWWRRNLTEGPAPLQEVASYSNSSKKWEWDGNDDD